MNYQLEDIGVDFKKIVFSLNQKSLPVVVILSMVLSLSTPFLLYPTIASAATVILTPNSVGNYGDWTQTGGSGANTDAKKVNAVGTNNGDTSYISSDTNNKYQTFVVPGAAIGTGGTINSVTIFAWAKGVPGGNQDFDLMVEKGTGNSNKDEGSTITPGSNYVLYNRVMTTNPFTGSAWTLNEVNNWTTRFGVARKNSSGSTFVTQLYVVVDYNPAPTTATLTVKKHVINDNGGNKIASNFTMTLTGQNNFAGNESGTVFSTLTPGTYTVGELAQAGYSSVITGNCAVNGTITLAAGDNKTCTVTNDDIAPILHLRKLVTNDNGGTAANTAWTLIADGTGSNDVSGITPVDSGASLKADTFALSETGPAGYTASAWTCVGGTQNGSSIILGLGETATCTITNDDVAPKLTLVKHLVTDGDPAETPPNANQWTLSAAGPTTITGATGTEEVTNVTVPAGSYELSESGSIAHYAQSGGWQCTGVGSQNGSQITLVPGNNAICTVTNVYVPPGTITVVKNTVGGDGTFNFTSDQLGSFQITTTNGSNNHSFTNLEPGTYSITEGDQPEGWLLSSATCTDGNSSYEPSSIALASATTVICTFTNTKKGNIIVKKVTDPTGQEQMFTFNPSWIEGNFSLADGQQYDSGYLTPDNYNVSETVPSGWTQVSATCDDGSSISEINLNPGETITCTFTNGKLPVLTVIKKY
jgi:hypothetical protein